MAKEPKLGEDAKPNLLILQEIRIKGKAVPKGAIISKSKFDNKADWLNLLNMPKPRVDETDEKVRDSAPKETKAVAPTAPGA